MGKPCIEVREFTGCDVITLNMLELRSLCSAIVELAVGSVSTEFPGNVMVGGAE